jgi:hypothetical protein
MQTLMQSLAVAVTLAVSAATFGGIALAGSKSTYHWAYPDGFQSKVTVPSLPGGSGIPAQYR